MLVDCRLPGGRSFTCDFGAKTLRIGSCDVLFDFSALDGLLLPVFRAEPAKVHQAESQKERAQGRLKTHYSVETYAFLTKSSTGSGISYMRNVAPSGDYKNVMKMRRVEEGSSRDDGQQGQERFLKKEEPDLNNYRTSFVAKAQVTWKAFGQFLCEH